MHSASPLRNKLRAGQRPTTRPAVLVVVRQTAGYQVRLAAIVMPWLASQKRELAALTSSASLKADAVESALCGYLAGIALAGLAANAIWGKSWADPVAALALTPLIVHEGWEAIHASQLGCNCSPP